MAGCTWTSHCVLGKPGNNPYCSHRALEFEAKGLRERLVRRESAPGKPFDHGSFEIVVEPMPEPDGPSLVELLADGEPLPELDLREVAGLLRKR